MSRTACGQRCQSDAVQGKFHSPDNPRCILAEDMHGPRLFRRRLVWLPTWWGALVVLVIVCSLAAGTVRHLGTWLAPNAPAVGRDGLGASTLIVEGWLDDDVLDDALEAVRNGRYTRVVTSGGPIETWREIQPWASYAERAAEHLRRQGLQSIPVVALPARQAANERTYLSALAVRDWLRSQGIAREEVDLFSAGVHARRSQLVYRIAFGPDVEIGILAAQPRRYDVERWWDTSEGAKAVLGELLGLAWTKCCFWPEPSTSAPEHAAHKPPA